MLKNYQWRTLILITPCLLIHEPLQALVLHAKGHMRVYWRGRCLAVRAPAIVGRDRALMRGFVGCPMRPCCAPIG
jgi:hypothetical protein